MSQETQTLKKYHSRLVNKSLAYYIKSCNFSPNFNYSFSISSFCRVAVLSLGRIVAFVFVYVLEIKTANIWRMSSGLSFWLSKKQLPIMTVRSESLDLDLDLSFSWAVYCGYTRLRGWLLFVFLSLMWPTKKKIIIEYIKILWNFHLFNTCISLIKSHSHETQIAKVLW